MGNQIAKIWEYIVVSLVREVGAAGLKVKFCEF